MSSADYGAPPLRTVKDYNNTGKYKSKSSSSAGYNTKTGRPNKVRIISDIRVAPPVSTLMPVDDNKYVSDRDEVHSGNWMPVVKRGGKASNMRPMKSEKGYKASPAPGNARSFPVAKSSAGMDIIKRKAPKGSVVAVTGRKEDFFYADALKTARDKISLDDLGIDRSRIRRAANGGILIEIVGVDSGLKADRLAVKLKDVIGIDANVARPIARGDIKLYNMDDSISSDEVCSWLAEIGDCSQGLIKSSNISRQRNGLHSIFINCPLILAIKVAKMGKIRLGWSSVGVELLKKRPIKCFRCWHFGHLKNTCKRH